MGCNAFQMFIHMFGTLKLHFFLFSAVKLRPKEGETYFDVVAIVDPVTRDAQRLAPLLLVRSRVVSNFKFPHFGIFLFDYVVTSGFLIICLSFTMHLSVEILIRLHFTLTRSCSGTVQRAFSFTILTAEFAMTLFLRKVSACQKECLKYEERVTVLKTTNEKVGGW